MAVVAGCGCALAAEKSYRIEFAYNPTILGSASSGDLGASNLNSNPQKFISAGCEYLDKFTDQTVSNCTLDKSGTGWTIGSTSTGTGKVIFNLSELGQVKAKRIEVSIVAKNANNTCYIKINDDDALEFLQKSPSLRASYNYTFKFEVDLAGNSLAKLKLLNSQSETQKSNVPFYLTAIEVFFEDGEEEKADTDPEMKTGEGTFATDGTEFGCGEGRLHFDNIVNIMDGKAVFNTDNRLTVSAPDGYFLAEVEFQGASAEGSIRASTGSVTAGKWLPAVGDIALNAVVFATASQESFTFTGVKIKYLPFRIDHSQVLSTIEFAATETTANSINIHSAFANSNASTVEKFIIRANGVKIAEKRATATEATFTGLPYLTDSRLTISPVISGTERQPELLDGTTLPNLGATNYTIAANMLLYTPRADNPALCDVGAILRLSLPEDIPAGLYSNFQVSVANHPEAEIQPGDGFIDIYIPTYLMGIPFDGTRPDFTNVEFETFTITLTPTYQFYVAEDFRSLLATPATNRLKVSALDSDGIQTVTFDSQQFQATFGTDSEVSHIPALAADPADTTTHYYTLQGIEVSASDLTPGLYIQRRGTRTTLLRHH